MLAIALELKDEMSHDRQRLLKPVEGKVLLSIKTNDGSYWSSEQYPERWISNAKNPSDVLFAAALEGLHKRLVEDFAAFEDGDIVQLRQYVA